MELNRTSAASPAEACFVASFAGSCGELGVQKLAATASCSVLARSFALATMCVCGQAPLAAEAAVGSSG